jgi:hypothetical protein
MTKSQTVVVLFCAYHKDLTAQEINTQHYTGTNIINNLREYLLVPGEIVKGVAGVGKCPYVGFVTRIGIAILIRGHNQRDVWFDSDPAINNHADVRAILGNSNAVLNEDQLTKLALLFNSNSI